MRTIVTEVPGAVDVPVAVGVRPVGPTTILDHREAVDIVVVAVVAVVGAAVVIVRVAAVVVDPPRHVEAGVTVLPGLVVVVPVVPVALAVPTTVLVVLAILIVPLHVP